MFLKRIIKEQAAEKKIVVFIDEVAWVDRHNKSGFLSALGHFYNTYSETHHNLIMILCGSDSVWLENNIIQNLKSLYQRVDLQIPQ